MTKKWLGRVQVYLSRGREVHSFCWLNMAKDGSLSFGLSSSSVRFAEYGKAVSRGGTFVGHAKTLTRGNADIADAPRAHATLHPPSLRQSTGIAQMKDDRRVVDRWELDWFPVANANLVGVLYSGRIVDLSSPSRSTGKREIVNVPTDVECLRMDIVLFPRKPRSSMRLDSPGTMTNLVGICPHYLVGCHFYRDDQTTAAMYIAGS